MWARCVYVEQKNVRPVKYLEIQLNITAISLTRERSILQLRVIFVMVGVVCYSKLQGSWLVVLS